MDDVDGNDDGRCEGSQLGDDGVGVWADANVVVVVVDKDRGGGSRGTRRGLNDDDRRIDDRPPPRMLVSVPMPIVCYRTNSDFPGINLPP